MQGTSVTKSAAYAVGKIVDFRWKAQMIGYWSIYLSQGAFLGSLGPALQEMSSDRDSVADYNPAFALHGISAIISAGFFGDILIHTCVKSSLGRNALHLLLGTLALFLAAWYVGLPFVNQYGGHLGVSYYMIIKGFLIAISNVIINKCAAWTFSESDNGTTTPEEKKRRIVNSLNGAFACGTFLGPVIAIAVRLLKLELHYLYGTIGALAFLGSVLIYATDCPHPLGEESASLLSYNEDLLSVPPTLPSPISGSVFLHVKNDLTGASMNPDSYDPVSNFFVLLVMVIATLYTGIQVGLAAFLFQYLMIRIPLSFGHMTHAVACLILFLFWGSLATSYALFTSCFFASLTTRHLLGLSVVSVLSITMVIYGQDYFGEAYRVQTLTISLMAYAVFLSPMFTGTVRTLNAVVSQDLVARVSSLLVFGCFCGESFVPVLMGFFMGNYSGSAFGPAAIVYITFAMTVMLMCVAILLVYTQDKKEAQKDKPVTSPAHDLLKNTKP